MTDRETLITLTRLAFLNAVILSLLTIQFVVPVAFLLLIWIIPAVFALEVYSTSDWVSILLSGLLLIVLTFILYGVDVVWLLVYLLTGLAAGVARRVRLPSILRLACIGTTLFLVMVGLTTLLIRLTTLPWQAIQEALDTIPLATDLPVASLFLIGLMVWMVATAVGIEWLLSRVLSTLEVAKTEKADASV